MPNVMNAKVNQRIIRAQYEIPSSVHISREALDLLSKLFVSDPKKRITAPQIQQHPWLSGELASTLAVLTQHHALHPLSKLFVSGPKERVTASQTQQHH